MEDFGDAPGSEPSTARVLALIFEAMAGSVAKSEDPAIPVDVRRAFLEELRKLSRRAK